MHDGPALSAQKSRRNAKRFRLMIYSRPWPGCLSTSLKGIFILHLRGEKRPMVSLQSPDFNNGWLNSEPYIMRANNGSSFSVFQFKHNHV